MVRATFSGFNTALSALQANQKRLDITGQNLLIIRILFPIILMGMNLQ